VKVQGHSRLTKILDEEDIDVLLVSDNNGNPVLIVVQFDNNTVIVDQAGNSSFDEKLRLYGIDKGPIVNKLKV
jgi:hypothetical protein